MLSKERFSARITCGVHLILRIQMASPNKSNKLIVLMEKRYVFWEAEIIKRKTFYLDQFHSIKEKQV